MANQGLTVQGLNLALVWKKRPLRLMWMLCLVSIPNEAYCLRAQERRIVIQSRGCKQLCWRCSDHLGARQSRRAVLMGVQWQLQMVTLKCWLAIGAERPGAHLFCIVAFFPSHFVHLSPADISISICSEPILTVFANIPQLLWLSIIFFFYSSLIMFTALFPCPCSSFLRKDYLKGDERDKGEGEAGEGRRGDLN